MFSGFLGPSSFFEPDSRTVQNVALCFGLSYLLSDGRSVHAEDFSQKLYLDEALWGLTWHTDAFRPDLENLWLIYFEVLKYQIIFSWSTETFPMITEENALGKLNIQFLPQKSQV